MATREVDIQGLICPAPVIEMTKIERTLEKGDTLVVVMSVDGKTNVEGWAKGNGLDITDFKKEGGKAVFTLVKR